MVLAAIESGPCKRTTESLQMSNKNAFHCKLFKIINTDHRKWVGALNMAGALIWMITVVGTIQTLKYYRSRCAHYVTYWFAMERFCSYVWGPVEMGFCRRDMYILHPVYTIAL